MKRIKELNKGTLRLLTVSACCVTIIMLAILFINSNSNGHTILGILTYAEAAAILLSLLTFPLFFAVVRIVLWIIDGFKEE